MNRDRSKRLPVRTLTGIVGAMVGLSALAVGSAMAQSGTPTTGAQSTPNPDESLDLAQLAAMARAGRGGGSSADNDGLKSWKDVSEGYEKVISTADGDSFYNLYVDKKANQVLAELPRGFEKQHHFFAMTVAGGETFAGLQAGDIYTKWKRIGNRLALIQPQIAVRSTGDQESKDSLETVFTDRVLLDVPIVAMGPTGQPVIDMDALLVGKATNFFGASARGLNPQLTTVDSIKAFPQNVEIQFEGPIAGGTIKKFHYSISNIRGSRSFKPRQADQRVGYFVTTYTDLGQYQNDEKSRRLVNRWNLEKADPKLTLSPPKEPIIYYIEHTVPIRYRRWVREGVEQWNDAFRKIGIDGAIQVQYQDKQSGANMEKDPEDVRYNFIRWISNDVATAIGPSRVNPMTGEILDADVVLTDGWVRVFTYRWEDLLGNLATEGYAPSTLEWLEEHPKWDPRLRLATPAQRDQIIYERQQRRAEGQNQMQTLESMGGFIPGTSMIGTDEFDGLGGRASQVSGMCMAATGKALDLATMRMYLSMIDFFADDLAKISAAADAGVTQARGAEPEIDEETLEMIRKQLEENPGLRAMIPPEYLALLEKKADEPKDEAKDDEGDKEAPKKEDKPKKDQGDMIDGVPEWFVGPMLAELVAHEVGHTLGLRHNFKGSSSYSLNEINSEDIKGKKPWSASVMDYNGINIMMPGFGTEQGDYSSYHIGPYDYWAIEYGYGPEKNLEKVLSRVAEPELAYATDEDTFGPDPRARRYDLSENPLDYAKNQMELVETIRRGLLGKFVEDGDSWSRARRGYLITLNTQMQSLSMMANWVGSAYVYRDKKGDPGDRAPIEVVPAERQREALEFVINNAFKDEAFGLTPELLAHTTVDKWWDDIGSVLADAALPVHDRVMGMQAAALTMLLNPQTVQRVYDYELFVPSDQDALTLAELMQTVTESIWSEIGAKPTKQYTDRAPMISSLRRNLQREHLDRLLDMAFETRGFNSSAKPVKMLAMMHLRRIKDGVDSVLTSRDMLDTYTRAHLEEISTRVGKALDAGYLYRDNG